jgi:4a-hydroxytetrahydrobiopterin dehydratase
MRQYINIIEHADKQDTKKFTPSDDDLDDIKSQFLPDWEILDHKTLQAKYVAKSPNHALKFMKFMNRLAEKMDHHPEVTKDVAEVTVKTSTFDVKALTILDFKLALAVDRYAEKNNIEQVSMQSNFGMHESRRKHN